ncbi:substrate-binding domain-containing protein [Actinomadura chokoriensis]|uniref:substrate-binding domain-containing protein n=1 Tax=Actinomadura chokoriensis TaxID=454156 RepID=UPI0031F97831
MTRLRGVAAAALCIGLAATGCSGSDASKKGRKTIGVSFAAPRIALYSGMQKGIQAEAKKLGVDVVFTDAGGDPLKQANDINDLIAKNVDGILVSAIDAKAIVAPLNAAKAAKIPVMTVARDVEDKSSRASYIGNDWGKSGRQIAEWTCKTVGTGKIIMIKGPSAAPYVQEMTKAYKAVVGSADCPDMTVAHEVNVSALTSEEGLKATKASLSAVPDAKVVYANLDDFLTGVVQAINEAGKSGRITVTGFDGIPSTLAMVRDGRVGFEIALQPKKWGATALQTMVGELDGKKAPSVVNIETRPFDKTNSDDLTETDLE